MTKKDKALKSEAKKELPTNNDEKKNEKKNEKKIKKRK